MGGAERSDAFRRIGERLAHALARGSSDHVVAIERGRQGHGRIEVLRELVAELAQFVERQIVQLDTFFKGEAHRVSDLLVRGAEGNAFVNEVSCRCHGIQIARGCRGFHAFAIEVESAS